MFDRILRETCIAFGLVLLTVAPAFAGGRYVVISLSFDMQGEDVKAPWIEDWHCVYDLKTGAFSVPPDFAENNAKAVKYPEIK